MTPISAPSLESLISRYGETTVRRRRGAWLVGWALAAAAYVGLLAYPNVDARDDLDASIAAAQQQRNDAEHFASEYEKVAANFKANQDRLASLHEVLPDDSNLPQFLGQLGGMAKGLDVAIERLEPKAEETHGFYAETGLRVQVRGSFHQIATLIDQIGNLPRIVTIRHVSLSNPKAQDQRVLIEGTFDVSVYRFLSEAQQKALAEQKAPPP